ncbi:hypothetical protein AEMCBJ_03945 [Cupriavidus necator]
MLSLMSLNNRVAIRAPIPSAPRATHCAMAQVAAAGSAGLNAAPPAPGPTARASGCGCGAQTRCFRSLPSRRRSARSSIPRMKLTSARCSFTRLWRPYWWPRSAYGTCLRSRLLPAREQALVSLLGLLANCTLQIPDGLQIVGGGRTLAATATRRRHACLQFQLTGLSRSQRWAIPGEGFVTREDVPDDYRQLARCGNSRDLLTAMIPDAQEEGTNGAGRLRCSPGSLN